MILTRLPFLTVKRVEYGEIIDGKLIAAVKTDAGILASEKALVNMLSLGYLNRKIFLIVLYDEESLAHGTEAVRLAAAR